MSDDEDEKADYTKYRRLLTLSKVKLRQCIEFRNSRPSAYISQDNSKAPRVAKDRNARRGDEVGAAVGNGTYGFCLMPIVSRGAITPHLTLAVVRLVSTRHRLRQRYSRENQM